MRRLLFLALLLIAVPAAAQVSNPPTVEVKDEGTTQGRVVSLNCVGAGVACTVSGFASTITVAGSSANVAEVSIDLGTSGGEVFSATVTGQAWVTASSKIVCTPFATSADGQTVETYFAAGFTAMAATRVVGTGFDVGIDSPRGATGIFRFHCTGA